MIIKSRDFIYWMQGLMELGDPMTLNEKQVELIKKHLAMVFIHEIDPSFPAEQQSQLGMAHTDLICTQDMSTQQVYPQGSQIYRC